MRNSISTIIIIVTAGILLFIVPLMSFADRQDNVTQENVKLIVEEFVTDIINTGKLTKTKYQDFVNELHSTGSNTYEIEMEIHVLDENPEKKNMQANYTKIGENVYVIYYDTQILPRIGISVNDEVLNTENDTITLKQGDKVFVEVKNENSTTSQTLKSSFLGFSNAGEYVISANSSGMVTVNGEGIVADKVSEEELLQYEYKITYNANSGTGALASQGKNYGKDITITNVLPQKTGYNFLGWSTNPSSQEVTYKPGDVFSINANVTLYAVWEIKTFKIIYNANGGEGSPNLQIKTWGIDLKLSEIKPKRNGYTFLGWSTNLDDKEAMYQPGSKFTINENTVLYAIWKPHKYKITYNANGGENAPDFQTKTHDVVLTLTSVQPTRKGHTFLGWNTNAVATSVQYLPGDKFTIEKDTTLYAVWKINTFKITYDANGGVGEPEQQIKVYGEDLVLSLKEPTKTGYTFLGWNTNESATTVEYQSGSTFRDNADTKLYAVWKINTYIIKYNANRGSGAPEQQIKTYGIDLILSSIEPICTGYTFLGWSISSTEIIPTYKPGDTFGDNKDITLYAIWRINTYTVSYNANGGTGAPPEQIKTYNIDLTLSSAKPIRQGYTFLGWNTSRNLDTAMYNAGDTLKINDNVTLYAIWDLNKYTIIYNANGGSGQPASQIKLHGIDLTLSSTKPTKTGYTFLGWNTTSTATTALYQAGSTFTTNADTTLYAIWKINKYTVTYNANGGTGAPSAQTKTYNVNLMLSTTKPTKYGYTFLGWSTTSTAATATYQPGATFTTNANTELFAVWQLNIYTVLYNANGGSGAPNAQTKTHGVTLTLSSVKPTRSGYAFLGWSTTSTGTTALYQAGSTFTTNADTTLYAIWQINTYIVSYNANGGTGAPGVQPKTHGATLTLSSVKPTRSGYTFLGWNTNASATSAAYQPGSAFTSNENTTLYAIWQINTYTVSYNANGGTGAPNAQTKTHGVTLTLSSVKPTKSGYVFLGWNTNASAKSAEYQPGSAFTTNANTPLYAIWQLGTYKITYNRNGGTGNNSSVSYNIGINATLKSATTFTAPSGKHFLQWNTKSDGTGTSYNAGATYTANTDITLYAIWQINTYTVSYNANGGSGAPSSQTKKYGVALTLSSTKPTKKGYTFQGWGTSSSATSVSYAAGASYTANANITLYAIWKSNEYYAIQNGKLVKCPNASAWYGGYSYGSGESSDGYYGGWGHTNGDDDSNWGASTGSLSTNGCSKLTIETYVYNWGNTSPSANLSVKSGSTSLLDTDLITSSGTTTSRTIDVSGYSTVTIRINTAAGSGENAWINVGLKNIRFHN